LINLYFTTESEGGGREKRKLKEGSVFLAVEFPCLKLTPTTTIRKAAAAAAAAAATAY
jgi:hypothetical protein